MKGACYIRSYPDYGDNIIGEYPAGTVVEFFLEDVGGWYKVQIRRHGWVYGCTVLLTEIKRSGL